MAQPPMTDEALRCGEAAMARILERHHPGLKFTFGPRQEMAEPAAGRPAEDLDTDDSPEAS